MENLKTSLNGFRADCEFKNVPVAFVNALRRILLSELPTVVVTNVQIHESTSQEIQYEMLRLRTEMLPINVRPDELGVVRDTKISIRMDPSPERRIAMSTDFTVNGPRQDIILKDRDLGTPLYFWAIEPEKALHVTASLAVVSGNNGVLDGRPVGAGSQVCVATFKNHIDMELAKQERDRVIAENGDLDVFDNHDVQRCWSRDSEGRPNWFDFTVESIGVMDAKDLLKKALEILKGKILEMNKADVVKDDEGAYMLEIATEGHTLGALAQAMIYSAGPPKVEDVRYTIGHPLTPKLNIRFWTSMSGREVVDRFVKEAVALCETILRSV